MKTHILTLATLLSLNAAYAQNAKVARVDFNKVSQPCVLSDYSFSADMVEGALKKKLSDSKMGSASKSSDGFRILKGVVIPEITKDKIDFYYKVEDHKPNSTVYILTSKGYDNFMKMETDSVAVQNTITYLNTFVKDATAFDLNNQIDKQSDLIKDDEKKQKHLIGDGEDFIKDKAKLESRISDNAIETGALKTEMENQQKALELVRTKKATIEGMSDLKKEVSKQEDVTKKATKKYERAVNDGADYKQDLAKLEVKMADNKGEQSKIKSTIEADNAKLQELRTKLNDLR